MTTLEHVLWIGGANGAGKTTLATRLARRHGLRWYSADAHTWEHRDAALATGHAAASHWEAMPSRSATPLRSRIPRRWSGSTSTSSAAR